MAVKKVLRFKIGDWIVHYTYGVGKVVDILDRDLDGHRETYFKVSTAEIEYWLPSEKADADHIKPVRSEKEFNQALTIISKPPELMSESSTRIKRLINERWLDGSLPARAALLRDLNGYNSIKKLSYDEKKTFEKAENNFIDEWIISNPELSRIQAKKQLTDALTASIQAKVFTH